MAADDEIEAPAPAVQDDWGDDDETVEAIQADATAELGVPAGAAPSEIELDTKKEDLKEDQAPAEETPPEDAPPLEPFAAATDDEKAKRSCTDKALYWRVSLFKPAGVPAGENKFEDIFARTNATLHAALLPFAIITFVVLFMNLCTKWDINPRWKERIPCTFQDDMSSFFTQYKAGVRALLILDLVPAGVAIVCCFMYLHGWTPQKRPMLGWLALGWAWKVIVPLLMFTMINFKMPTFIPYDTVTQKACEVVLSLTFNPPGASTANGYMKTKYENLRTVTGSYYSNPKNFMFPQYSGFESSLATIATDVFGAEEDDNNKCTYVDDDASFFNEIAKFLKPNKAIENYCKKGFEITQGDRDKGPLWPVLVLADGMQNFVNGLALSQHACSGVGTATTSIAINTDITLTQVCKHWYTSTTQLECEGIIPGTSVAGSIYITCTEATHWGGSGVAAMTRALATEELKQAICLIKPALVDPQTGYKALDSLLCPSSTGTGGFVAASTSLDTAATTQTHIDAASVVAIGQARTKSAVGLSMFPATNYTGLAALIQSAAISLTPSTSATSLNDRSDYLRWTSQDGVEMMQVALTYLKKQMDTLVSTGDQGINKAGITNAARTTLVATEFLSLGKNIDVSMFHSMYNVARKAALSTSSAINKIGQLVGIFAGFMAVVTLVPFSVSVLTGMIKGAKTAKAMIQQSECMEDERDKRKVNIFLSMVLTNCIALVAIPMIAIPIFIYQAFADQTFIITVLGFIIIVVAFFIGNMDQWTAKGNTNWYILGVEILGWFMVFLGILLWMIFDEFSILRDAINFLVDKFFILIIISAVIVHVLSDLIDPETIPDRTIFGHLFTHRCQVVSLFVFKVFWSILSVVFGLCFFAAESGDWAMFIDAIQMFVTWIFNSKFTALITMNTTILVLGKMFEDFDSVQYTGDAEQAKEPVPSQLHKLKMYACEMPH